MSGHRLVRVDSAALHASVCECGWRSAEALTTRSAEARWRIHARGVRAATAYRRAEDVRKAAAQRSAETAALRARARLRADELRSRRGPADAHGERGGTVVRERPPPEAARRLASARELAGVSTEDLWVRYVMVGGAVSVETLSAILAGTSPVDGYDHDLIAIALNEMFADAGFGNPIDYWGSS